MGPKLVFLGIYIWCLFQIRCTDGEEESTLEVTTAETGIAARADTVVSSSTPNSTFPEEFKKIHPDQFITLENLENSANIKERIPRFVSDLIARNINSTIDEYELNANLYRKFSKCSVKGFPQSYRDKAMGCGAELGMNFVRYLRITQGHERIANVGSQLYKECYDSSANKRSGMMSFLFKPKALIMDKNMCIQSNGTDGLDSTKVLEHIYGNLRFDGETLEAHLNNVDECIYTADQTFFNNC